MNASLQQPKGLWVLAPAHRQSFFMGVWFLSIAFANLLAVGMLIFVLSPQLKRWMHGDR